MVRIAALDIGGANIKAAFPGGGACTVPFELWRRPRELCSVLEQLIARRLRPLDALAVTLTGELCDCFASKAEGVRHIVRSVRRAVRRAAPRAAVLVWRTDGRLVPAEIAMRDPLPAAAANWLALAELAGSFAPRGLAVLIDIGSTTTDIVPLVDGTPVPLGRTDTERLLAGELIYAGAARTPVAALVQELQYREHLCPVAAELFATAHDAHLVLGLAAEAPRDRATADGRPATRRHARARLARMVCADPADFTAQDARLAAERIVEAHLERCDAAFARLRRRRLGPLRAVIASGSGERLARRAARRLVASLALAGAGVQAILLSRRLGPAASAAAPAVALREIVRQRLELPGDCMCPGARQQCATHG
jgi:hypothetical protein